MSEPDADAGGELGNFDLVVLAVVAYERKAIGSILIILQLVRRQVTSLRRQAGLLRCFAA